MGKNEPSRGNIGKGESSKSKPPGENAGASQAPNRWARAAAVSSGTGASGSSGGVTRSGASGNVANFSNAVGSKMVAASGGSVEAPAKVSFYSGRPHAEGQSWHSQAWDENSSG